MLASPLHSPTSLSPTPSIKSLQHTASHRHLPSRSPNRASRSPSPDIPSPPPPPLPASTTGTMRKAPPTIEVTGTTEDNVKHTQQTALERPRPPPSRQETTSTHHHHQQAADEGQQEDVFSLTDQELSEAYVFSKEIGFGNWGSVWLCKRKLHNVGEKVAIKLVHRSKTPTTAARVRALWNEMKVVRSVPTHPNIIGFESFIITPSYALVSMPYCPSLMPVGIPEDRARVYMKGLIDGVRFLHEHYVSHNDIKPANVLLSKADVPVLVDFGFATRWDAKDPDEPLISMIGWGTCEYLSPARARGQRHDERTSDVWSLGVTCFEVLMGRTPFEKSDQEQFSSTAELEVYYERTLAGAWIGEWQMSAAMEDLLKGMTHPVDSMRLTARQAVNHHAFKEESLFRSNLSRRSPRSTRHLTPVSPPRINLSKTQTDSHSSASTIAGLRYKKTASPPKKVVQTVVRTFADEGDASGQKKEEYDFLLYEKSSERPGAGGKKNEVSGGRGMGGVRGSPSKERLTATRAVKVKARHSPRKLIVASSPRRRVVSNASRTTLTNAPRLASHRSTPPPSAETTLNTSLDISQTSSLSDVSVLVESAPPVRVRSTRRGAAKVLKSRKRPEAIHVDLCRRQSSSRVHKDSDRNGEDKENRGLDIKRVDETRLEKAGGKALQVLSASNSRVPVLLENHRFTNGSEAGALRVTSAAINHQAFDDGQSLRPAVSQQTLTPRVSENSLASIKIAQSSQDAGLDTNLDRILLWVRNVDRLVEETRDSIKTRNAVASPSVNSHKPSHSESFLSIPRAHKTDTLRPAGPSHVQSPSYTVTPSREVLNEVTVFLPNGRGLADVPESITGCPSAGRSLSSPPTKQTSTDLAQLDEETPPVPQTIHFANPPLQEISRDEASKSTRLKRSRSKLLAVFQAGHEPSTDPTFSSVPTERLSFLKFPPPEAQVAQPPTVKHRSSLLRLKSIKNIRSALFRDKHASPVPVPTPSPAGQAKGGILRPPSWQTSSHAPPPPPPTPSSINISEPLTPRSPISPPPAALIPLPRVEDDDARFGTLTSRNSVSRSGTANTHRSAPSITEGLKFLFSSAPTPPPLFKEKPDRERMVRSGTPNTMMSGWTDTTYGGEANVGQYGVSQTTRDDGSSKGRLAMAFKGLSFGRKKKLAPPNTNPLDYDY